MHTTPWPNHILPTHITYNPHNLAYTQLASPPSSWNTHTHNPQVPIPKHITPFISLMNQLPKSTSPLMWFPILTYLHDDTLSWHTHAHTSPTPMLIPMKPTTPCTSSHTQITPLLQGHTQNPPNSHPLSQVTTQTHTQNITQVHTHTPQVHPPKTSSPNPSLSHKLPKTTPTHSSPIILTTPNL